MAFSFGNKDEKEGKKDITKISEFSDAKRKKEEEVKLSFMDGINDLEKLAGDLDSTLEDVHKVITHDDLKKIYQAFLVCDKFFAHFQFKKPKS